MYFIKFKDSEYYSTEEFHRDRPAVDHLSEAGHKDRIELSAEWVNSLVRASEEGVTLIDYGCGTGGALSLIETENKIGYDFNAPAVRYAQDRGRPVEFRDFVNEPPLRSNIAMITECLEHLSDPVKFLFELDADWLVMSVPNGETEESHYEAHTHGMDEPGCREYLIKGSGWTPVLMKNVWGTQLWLARR